MRWCQSSHVFTMISADIRQFVQNAVVASCSASPPRPALPSHTDTG
jgi:hypothetical protein